MRTAMMMLGLLLSPTAFAQTGDDADPVKIIRNADGTRVYILPGRVVEGTRHKPSAFYVLQRSSIDYDWSSLEQGFVSKILQATQKHPF